MRISDWSSDVCSSDLRFLNAVHCADGLLHYLAAPNRLLFSLRNGMADLRRTLRGVADGSGDVVHGSGGLLKCGGLLLGAARQIVGGGADLAGTRMGAFRAIGAHAQYGATRRRQSVEGGRIGKKRE